MEGRPSPNVRTLLGRCARPAGHPGACSVETTADRRWAPPESARARELRLELEAEVPADALRSALELLRAAHTRHPFIVAELLTAAAWRSE